MFSLFSLLVLACGTVSTQFASGLHLPQIEPLVKMDAEFSGPGWVFGTRTYQALSDGSFLAIYNDPKVRAQNSAQ